MGVKVFPARTALGFYFHVSVVSDFTLPVFVLSFPTPQHRILSVFTQTKPRFPWPRCFLCGDFFFFFFIFGRFLYDFPSSLVSNPFRFKLLTAGRSDIFYPQNRSLSSHPVNSCRVCSSPHESGHGSVLLETAPASAQLHRVVTGLSSPRRCFHFQLIPRQPPDRGGFFFMLCLPAPAINCN